MDHHHHHHHNQYVKYRNNYEIDEMEIDYDVNSKLNQNNNNNNGKDNNNGSSRNNRTTDGQTMMHILKANIGTGVLAMPSAFKNVGLYLGLIMIPIIGSICIHCMNILIESHNHLCDRFNYESLDYDQVAALGLACGPKLFRRLAKRAHIIVTIFLIFTQFGFCCVYIMFVIENLQLAMLNLISIEYSTTTYLILVFPIIGLTSCTSNLKYLARISTLANILQLIGLGLIFFDLIQFNTYSKRYDLTNSSYVVELSNNNNSSSSSSSSSSNFQQVNNNIRSFINVFEFISKDILAGLPLFFATAVYAFEGIGVVLPVIKEMQNPNRILGLNGVLNTSMALVAILYMGIGYFGYAKYGQFVQGSITLNLPETTLNELVRLTFAIAIGLSYSLQFYVPWTIIWPHIDESLFYSYRPRIPRNKLRILSKLSAENRWDIKEYLLSQSNHCCNNNNQKSQIEVDSNKLELEDQNSFQLEDQNSNASTFATSYTMSTMAGGNLKQRFNSNQNQYGTILIDSNDQQQQQPVIIISDSAAAAAATTTTTTGKFISQEKRRNRLEDVMELDEDSIPDVEWRPPPKSMRGKRKLVRYTVILVTVSFTFVAAALIPRLDLFISLIGALASSSLAIIFPAIIQMCTFWNYVDEEEEDGDGDGDNNDDDNNSDNNNLTTKLIRKNPSNLRRKFRKRILWHLFVIKNLLLIIFGILGLITGSWISIKQLTSI